MIHCFESDADTRQTSLRQICFDPYWGFENYDLEHIYILRLEPVSKGAWQPVLSVDPPFVQGFMREAELGRVSTLFSGDPATSAFTVYKQLAVRRSARLNPHK